MCDKIRGVAVERSTKHKKQVWPESLLVLQSYQSYLRRQAAKNLHQCGLEDFHLRLGANGHPKISREALCDVADPHPVHISHLGHYQLHVQTARHPHACEVATPSGGMHAL